VLIGRLVSIAYSLSALVVLFFVGRSVFDTRAALVGALLAALCPTTVDYAQQLRPMDRRCSSGFCISSAACASSSVRDGRPPCLPAPHSAFAMATRVMLAAAGPVLLVVDVVVWRRARRVARSDTPLAARRRTRVCSGGLLCA
jgi:hypothetical protein